jgi:hypothetical protein
MSPPGGPPAGAFFSGFSATIASVVMSRLATDDASWRAQRTTLVGSMMPAFRKSYAATSFDDLVGAHEDRFRYREAERLGRLEIDEKFEFRRLLHR